MPYTFVALGILMTAGITDISFRRLNGKNSSGKKVYILFWGIVLILICGLRGMSVGRDTRMYQRIYNAFANSVSLRDAFYNYSYTEYGYYLLAYFFSKFADYQTFLLCISVLSILPVIYVVYKYSDNMSLSLVIYVCFSYYTFCMSAQRQAVAIGMTMIAYHYVRQKKLISFLSCVALGILFHTSAVLFLPVYWIDKIPYKKWVIIASVVLMGICFVFRGAFWALATRFARQQYFSNDAGGELMYLFMLLTVALGFFFRSKFIENNLDNKVLLYLQILSACLWPIASINSAVARMYYYYHILLILYVPAILKAIDDWIFRLVVAVGYLGVSAYFLFDEVMKLSKQFVPYAFFWQ